MNTPVPRIRFSWLFPAVTLALAACGPAEDEDELSQDDAALDGDLGSPVQLLQRALGVDETAATQRLLAQTALQELGDAYEEAHADLFAGAWIDTDATGAVHVRLKGATSAQIDEVRARFPAGYPVEVLEATHSSAELDGFLDALGEVPEGVVTLRLSAEQNRIIAVAKSGASEAVRAELARVMPETAFTVTEQDPVGTPTTFEDATCKNRRECGHKLRGGTEINFGGEICSTGFTGHDSDGHRYLISAAHCGHLGSEPGMPVHTGFILGKVTKYQHSGTLDMLAVKLNADWKDDPMGHLYDVSSRKYDSVDTVLGPAAISKGTFICRAGRTSGKRCGFVDDASATVTVSGTRFTRQMVVKACARPGDSGGPVYTFSAFNVGAVLITTIKAVGIVSGGNFDPDGSCSSSPIFTASYVKRFAKLHGVKVGTP